MLTRTPSPFATALCVVSCFASLQSVVAQCTYAWPAGTFAGGCNDDIYTAVYDDSGNLLVGGRFTVAGNVPAARIASWNGTTWSALGTGLNADVRDIVVMPNGDLVVGGDFNIAGGISAQGVARWDGTTWTALGLGVSSLGPLPPSVRALTVLNGDLYVGGRFAMAGALPAANIAAWDGSTWSALGAGLGGEVEALDSHYGFQVTATGNFQSAGGTVATGLAQWFGSSWHVGSGLGAGGAGMSMARSYFQELYIGGDFGSGPLSNIGRVIGNGMNAVGTGTNGPVRALAAVPTAVIAGGTFTLAGGVPVTNIARWDGTVWGGLGGGVNGDVRDLVYSPAGELIVVGTFTNAAGNNVGRIARVVSSCGPQVTDLGAGCVGAAGPNVQTVTRSPTVGGGLAATGSGYPAGSVGLAIVDLQLIPQPVPLSIFFPSFPGCTLSVNYGTSLAAVLLPQGGTAEVAWPIPSHPALAGVDLFQQFAALEFDANGISSISTSNTVQARVGAF